jgi:hypothetical protein
MNRINFHYRNWHAIYNSLQVLFWPLQEGNNTNACIQFLIFILVGQGFSILENNADLCWCVGGDADCVFLFGQRSRTRLANGSRVV